KLEDMLPVRFGNSDQDPKLYGIVIDTSRSMQMASRLIMLKEAATQLLELLNPEDMVTVVTFSGEVTVLQAPTKAKNREAIAKLINDAKPSQGTYLGKGMQTAYELMKNLPYDEKQVVLISDGASYGLEPDDPVAVAKQMLAEGILTTVIDPRVTDEDHIKVLQDIAKAGAKNGSDADYAYENYYLIENEESVKDLIFNEVADDFTESVINGYSVVNVKKKKDDVMQGISSLPALYGYVYSKAKASATTVLTTVYERESGDVEAPIYAYWKYGNGKVASFTSALSGDWAENWVDNADATTFLTNVIRTNVPEARTAYPYSISVEYDGKYLDLEVTPAVLNPYATTDVHLTLPSGETIEQRLTFDSTKYFRRFEITDLGKYEINVVYTYNGAKSESTTPFHVSYYAEHNRFTAFDASTLYSTIGNHGTVSENSAPKIENDVADVATYELSFTLPFMITAILLYVVDVIVRKLKWKDVVSFFKKKKKGGV
ncbi:MAG: VWA domain-containing protein, partial [Clostridiales bacterium]|nr:VWA domain-containing protein [Clostridiales bacterium]